MEVLLQAPERIGRAVLGGLGGWGGRRRAELIARRLRGDAGVKDLEAETFYSFASARPVNDLEALACCILGEQPEFEPDALGRVQVPALLVAGEADPVATGARDLARQLGRGSFLELAGRNHMSAVPARQFKEAAIAFLAGQDV